MSNSLAPSHAFFTNAEKHRIDTEKIHNTEARRKQREARSKSNEALLHRAARAGDIFNVKRALDLGVDVNCTGSNNDTGISATFTFMFNIIRTDRLYLFMYTSVELLNAALHVACINGEIEVVKHLLEKGANKEAKTNVLQDCRTH